MSSLNSSVVLPLMKLPAHTVDGSTRLLNSILDTASTSTFITVSGLRSLNYSVKQHGIELRIKQLNGSRIASSRIIVLKLQSRTCVYEIEAYVVDEIATVAGRSKPPTLPPGCNLNMRYPISTFDVELLLGVNHLWLILSGKMRKLSDNLGLFSTPWGWVVLGNDKPLVQGEKPIRKQHAKEHCFLSGPERLASVLERMWKLEELPNDNSKAALSRDELKAI